MQSIELTCDVRATCRVRVVTEVGSYSIETESKTVHRAVGDTLGLVYDMMGEPFMWTIVYVSRL